MKLWIRIDAAVRSDPNVMELADRLKIPLPEAVGLCTLVWGAIAEHRPSGDISGIPFSTFDRWAQHSPRKGFPREVFGRVFVELFTSDGIARGWDKRQGALIEKAERERARKLRGKGAVVPRKVSVTERNGTELTTKATTGNPPSRIDVLPKSDCDSLFEKWSKEIGAIPYPRFRKALLVVRSSEAGRAFTIPELTNAVEAYGEWFKEQDDREQGFTSIEKTFAGNLPKWVALGKMPLTKNGELTERGAIIGTKKLREQRRGAA